MGSKVNSEEKIRKLKLLIVDDEEGILEALSELLGEKFRITLCSDAGQALREFGIKRHELVLADQRMPDVTGLKMIEEIKKIESSTVAILITGYSDIDTVIEAVNKGLLFRYISKPWDNKSLTEAIMEAAKKYLVDAGLLKEDYPIYF